MYKALMDIGNYKKGDIVPDELATVWDKMYEISPVEIFDGAKETKVVVDKKLEAPKQSNAMEDDYLNRNKHVVKKNLEEDSFNRDTLNRLLKLEKANKNRGSIIKVIESQLGGI